MLETVKRTYWITKTIQ